LQSALQSDLGRSTVRFGDLQLHETPEARLWRGTLGDVTASFFDQNQETRDAESKGTVKWFNPTKGYGFHQAAREATGTCLSISSAVERAGSPPS
jgi:hypothetical protein